MIPWTALERRWRDVILDAVVPGLAPPENAWASWWRASWTVRWGLRAAVWYVTLRAVWRTGRTMSALEVYDRDAVVQALGDGSIDRQVTMVLKLHACLLWAAGE